MSCDKCLHNEVCTALYELNGIPRIGSSQCAFFRDGAKYVEVICKPGADVYLARSGRVREIKIERVDVDPRTVTYAFGWHGGGYELLSESDFGKIVFFTKEEAEKALKGESKMSSIKNFEMWKNA